MSFLLNTVIAVHASLLLVSAAEFTVHISAHYPISNFVLPTSTLYIRGNGFGLNWDNGIAMTHSDSDDDTFTITITDSISIPNVFEFKVLINDKTWMIGANSMYSFSINTPSIVNIDIYPWFYTYQGGYEYIKRVYSPELNNFRDLVIYLPPSFNENPYKSYANVLIMHDGQNLFNDATSFAGVAWHCQDTMDELIVGSKIYEWIIIGIDNTDDRIYEYTYSSDPTYGGGGADIYLDFIEETVIPKVKSYYSERISDDLNRFSMIGSSLGGLLSCYTGWTRSEMYSKVGCMSSSFWWNSEDFNNTILDQSYESRPTKVYLDVGGLEGSTMIEPNKVVRNHFQSLGYVMDSDLDFYLDPTGRHNEQSWGARFDVPISFLFPVTPIPV